MFIFGPILRTKILAKTRGGSDSPRDKASLIDYKINNSKDRCFRKVQRGNVSRCRVYLVTEPVIGQNPRRIYSNHAIALKR